MRSNRKRLLCAAAVAAVGLLSGTSMADSYYFIHAGGGDWDGTSDPYYPWTDQTTSTFVNFPPDGTANNVYIFQNGTLGVSGISVVFNHTYSTGFNVLAIGSGNTLVQSIAGTYMLESADAIGTNNAVGTYTQNAGTHVVTGNIRIGQFGYATGVYNLGGTGSLSATFMYMEGGTFNQTGGTFTNSGLTLASGYAASYNLSGGSLTVNGDEHMYQSSSGAGIFTQSGASTHTVTGTLFDGGEYYGATTASFNLQGGSLTVGTLQLGDIVQSSGSPTKVPATFSQTGGTLTYTTFNQTGGIFSGTLTNKTTYNVSGGQLNGRLINQGTVNISSDFLATNGIENDTSISLPAHTLTLNGSGLDNEGSLFLSGSSIGGTGTKTNNGQIGGFGSLAGSGQFLNSGVFNQSGGAVAFQMSGNPYANYGNMNLSSGQQLRLTSASNSPQIDRLINQGTLNLNNAIITGNGGLDNETGGLIVGAGTISTAMFLNQAGAVVQLNSGTTNIVPAFANSGTIAMSGSAANLSGGAITNSGTVQGFGNVSSNLSNTSGIVEALGGTLILNGAVSNSAGGLITASTGNKVLVSGGLSANGGTINLTGGTFDNANKPLTNTGQISGYGSFRTGGLTNGDGAGHGSMTLSGGVTTVDGNLTNAAGSTLSVKYSPAIFTGNVTNNGTMKITGTTVTYAGTFTNSGVYNSDPAINNFADLVVPASGALVGGQGDEFNVSGDLISTSTQGPAWDTSAARLSFSGSPVHHLGVTGKDLGPTAEGYLDNFAFGSLFLATGETLVLQDGNVLPGGALYVGALDLAGGLPQVASISGQGLNIYYDPIRPENAYLGGQSFTLAGGGELAPVPEPALATGVLMLAIGCLHRRRKSG